METADHIPVLAKEAIQMLSIQPGDLVVDATFGRGGHTRQILEIGATVIAFDVDKSAIEYGMRHFVREIEAKRLILVNENFEKIDEVMEKLGIKGQVSAVLADFGVSSPQLDEGERGFSFRTDAPLDMRMDERLGVTAADLLAVLGKKELEHLFSENAQEHHAKKIAEIIVEERSKHPIRTTRQLADLIEKKIGREGHLHPATKIFLALRMQVNDELGVIETFLPKAFEQLRTGGRMATISFHEGEDRLCKEFMNKKEALGVGKMLTKRPIEPSDLEVEENKRSRSSKLRVIEKL
ncbi:MAG TPA: 16S rRNA (cytosine(1402)-N(4))-methyltransferase RsmH [Patescibacteria group bacterium]|nr:16S rRNA (cytosine(1402)-N(4))-methyltransferase RsmH [Patescibacteria group bacterium]